MFVTCVATWPTIMVKIYSTCWVNHTYYAIVCAFVFASRKKGLTHPYTTKHPYVFKSRGHWWDELSCCLDGETQTTSARGLHLITRGWFTHFALLHYVGSNNRSVDAKIWLDSRVRHTWLPGRCVAWQLIWPVDWQWKKQLNFTRSAREPMGLQWRAYLPIGRYGNAESAGSISTEVQVCWKDRLCQPILWHQHPRQV
jgi:hypothetical protein